MGRKFALTLSILAVLYGIYYFGISCFLNGKIDYLETLVFQKTGYRISSTNANIKAGIVPSVWFYADNTALLNDDGSKAVEIVNPSINIRLIPLLFKKINIKRFSASSIRANLVFDKDSKLKLGQYELQSIPETSINRLTADTESYTINLDDKLKAKQINLYGRQLIIKDFVNNKSLNFSTEAYLKTGKKVSNIKLSVNTGLPLNHIDSDRLAINGFIKNLDISDFSAYAEFLSKDKIKLLSGIINLTAQTVKTPDGRKQIISSADLKNFGIYKEDIKSSVYSKNNLNIKSDITTIQDGIRIKKIKISGTGIDTEISGDITKLSFGTPELDIRTVIKNSKAESIIALLPASKDLFPDIDTETLKQAGFWADVNGDLKINGKADLPEVFGKMHISNAYLVKPIANAKKADIKMDFKGDKFNLDCNIPAGAKENVTVNGYVNLDKERSADLYILSSENVDLKTAQIVLNPLHEILRFNLGPVPIMDIKGKGSINLRVTGTRKDPYAWGQFKFKETSASFNDIKHIIFTGGSGTLDFNNQDTVFKTQTAYMNGAPVTIKGDCNLLGKLDFDVEANNQNADSLLKALKTSPMLSDIEKTVSFVEHISGKLNLKLKLTGEITDINEIEFNKNIFANVNIKLLSDMVQIKGLPPILTAGEIEIDNLNSVINLNSKLNGSKISVTGKIQDNKSSLKFVSDRLNAGDALRSISPKSPYLRDFSTINSAFTAFYNGKADDIELNKIYLKGKIFSNKGAKSSIIVNDSNFELNNSNLKLPSLKGTLQNSPFNLSLNITNFFSDNRVVNGVCKVNSFNLNMLNEKALRYILPANILKTLNDFEFQNGKLNLNAGIVNNNLNASSNIANISFIYKPRKTKVTVNSGNISAKNNRLSLNKINASIGDMPVFVDGKIANFQTNPYLDLYLNTKPTQEFFDQFFNIDTVYPIKLKGDTILTAKLNGTMTNLSLNTVFDILEDSSIYYMGASIGEAENPVKITAKSVYSPDRLKINSFKYDKIIKSQNNKPVANTQLNASGMLNFMKNGNIGFNNFKVKTQTPTDAKIFNIIFRKPFMKQGVFTSDLVLNGTSQNPKISGNFSISSIDIPFFDSVIKDVSLNFKNGKIYIESKGTVLTNDVNLSAVMRNKISPPYIVEDLKLKLADLDVNKITDTLRDIEAESSRNPSYSSLSRTNNNQFDIKQFIVQKARIEADKIKVRNINADNFISSMTIDNKKIVNINDFKFDIAEGSVLGSLKYNLNNNQAGLKIHLDRANALIMSEALFDLKGQVYGSVNGDFDLSCTGTINEDCFKTLSGKGEFKIADGRIPKLGSLEYLLKAGNLFKGGLTGLSINGIIDLITPLKTGSFDSISGNISLADGIAKEINIYSGGKDLNMYMSGTYNIVTSVADMKIYGSLSKNITTVFGKIRNASLNTLFNTIPGINNNNEKLLLQEEIAKIPNIKDVTNIYRVFTVDVNGDINGENYVTSFRWVK